MIMKRIFIVFCLFIEVLCVSKTVAQKSGIDSLNARLLNAADTNKVKIFIQIGDEYKFKDNYEKALSNYLDGLKLADSIKNKESLFWI